MPRELFWVLLKHWIPWNLTIHWDSSQRFVSIKKPSGNQIGASKILLLRKEFVLVQQTREMHVCMYLCYGNIGHHWEFLDNWSQDNPTSKTLELEVCYNVSWSLTCGITYWTESWKIVPKETDLITRFGPGDLC